MTTLATRDASGVLATWPGEVEHDRSRTAKRWRLPDAPDGRRRFRVGACQGPIHYRADPFDAAGAWQEIDLDVTLTPLRAWDAACETNGYQVRLWQSLKYKGQTYSYVGQFRRAGLTVTLAPLLLAWTNEAGERETIARPTPGIAPAIDNEAGHVEWADCFGPGLSFRYNLAPDLFFKTLVIRSREDLPPPTITGPGLRLTLVMAVQWSGRPGNGFAAGVTTGVGPDSDLDAADEVLAGPEAHAHSDGRGRACLWMQRPRAWDSSDERRAVAVDWELRRRGGQVYALFGVPAEVLDDAALTYPLFVDTAISEEAVGAGVDDAQSVGSVWPGGNSSRSNATTTLIFGATTSNFYALGYRFTGVPIPQGATVDTAALTVCSSGSYSAASYGAPVVDIYCEAVDSGTSFTSGRYPDQITALTTAYAAWTISASWSSNVWYTSADLAAPVQEIVNRAGWSQGDLNLLTRYASTSLPGSNTYRNSRAYDYGASYGAKFNATYTESLATASAGAAWRVLAAGTAPASWRVAIAAAQSAAWRMTGAAARAAAWRLLTASDLAAAWRLSAAAGSPYAWAVLASGARAAAWRLLASADAASAWRLLDLAARGASWRVATALPAPSAWGILADEVVAAAWRILTGLEAATAWSVRSASARATTWRVLADVDASSAWHMLAARDEPSAWAVLAGTAVPASWRLMTVAEAAAAWSVLTSGSVSRAAAWRILAAMDATSAWSLLTAWTEASAWRVLGSLAAPASWAVLDGAAAEVAWRVAAAMDVASAWVIGSDAVEVPLIVIPAQARRLIGIAGPRDLSFIAPVRLLVHPADARTTSFTAQPRMRQFLARTR